MAKKKTAWKNSVAAKRLRRILRKVKKTPTSKKVGGIR